MKIEVSVKPSSRHQSIKEISPGHFQVAINAPAREGKANAALIDALSAYFSVPKSSVVILRGERGRKKIVEVLGLLGARGEELKAK